MNRFILTALILCIINLTGVCQDIPESIDENAKEIEKLRKQVESLKSEVKQRKQELEETKKELEETSKELKKEIETKTTELSLKDQLLDERQKLIDDKNKAIEEKNELLKNEEISQAEKDKELKAKTQRIADLQTLINTKDDLIDQKDETLKETQSNIESLEKNVATTEMLVKSKEETIDLQNESIEDARDRISVLQNNLLDKEKEIQDLVDVMSNKRKWVRVVQGVGFYNFRTPNYELQPKSSTELDQLEITNTNTGDWEGDYYTGFSIMAIDLDKDDDEQKISFGPFIGFGGKDFFENFYLGINAKLWMIHLNAGFNFHRFEVLKTGFKEGDILAVGQAIPTTEEWKVGIPYFGISVDSEFLLDVVGAVKK